IFVISFERPFVSHREIDHVQHVVRTGVRLVCSNNYSNKRSKVPDGGLYDGLPKTWENFHYDGVAKSWEIFYDETFHTINFSVNQDRFENNFRRGSWLTRRCDPGYSLFIRSEQGRLHVARKVDVYQKVTDLIIQRLEEGVVPWQRPWSSNSARAPQNFTTRRPYRGVNVFLTLAAEIGRAHV